VELWRHDYPERAVHFFDLPHDIVWGATARILHDLIRMVLGAPPALQPG
jgi:hypothetical protein